MLKQLELEDMDTAARIFRISFDQAFPTWTFQRNARARRFYEARGFALIRETEGAGNEEKEPDALYLWERA